MNREDAKSAKRREEKRVEEGIWEYLLMERSNFELWMHKGTVQKCGAHWCDNAMRKDEKE